MWGFGGVFEFLRTKLGLVVFFVGESSFPIIDLWDFGGVFEFLRTKLDLVVFLVGESSFPIIDFVGFWRSVCL